MNPVTKDHAMQSVHVEVVFGRSSDHPMMYTLVLENGSNPTYKENLILNIDNDGPHRPRRLGYDIRRADPVSDDIGRGWLFHGVLKPYPQKPLAGCDNQVEAQVAVKWVRGVRAIASLKREASLYEGELKSLQGLYVPEFYGLFTGNHDGVDIGCMLLEWCPGNDPFVEGKPSPDLIRMRAHAVKHLHEAGVYHGQLYERPDALCMSDGRHFLRAADRTVRIVGFQHAVLHNCDGSLKDAKVSREHTEGKWEEKEDVEEGGNAGEEGQEEESLYIVLGFSCQELDFADELTRRTRDVQSWKAVAWSTF